MLCSILCLHDDLNEINDNDSEIEHWMEGESASGNANKKCT